MKYQQNVHTATLAFSTIGAFVDTIINWSLHNCSAQGRWKWRSVMQIIYVNTDWSVTLFIRNVNRKFPSFLHDFWQFIRLSDAYFNLTRFYGPKKQFLYWFCAQISGQQALSYSGWKSQIFRFLSLSACRECDNVSLADKLSINTVPNEKPKRITDHEQISVFISTGNVCIFIIVRLTL